MLNFNESNWWWWWWEPRGFWHMARTVMDINRFHSSDDSFFFDKCLCCNACSRDVHDTRDGWRQTNFFSIVFPFARKVERNPIKLARDQTQLNINEDRETSKKINSVFMTSQWIESLNGPKPYVQSKQVEEIDVCPTSVRHPHYLMWCSRTVYIVNTT